MASYSTRGLPVTPHAAARMQQRGIPAEVVELLLAYGASERGPGGAEILYLDHAARRRIRDRAPARMGREVRSRRAVYAVLSRDGQVITVGHRRRRIRH